MDEITTIKQTIIKTCSEFNRDNLISVLNFLQNEHIEKKNINQNNDGIRINLDNLSDDLNTKLYHFVQFKLNEDKK